MQEYYQCSFNEQEGISNFFNKKTHLAKRANILDIVCVNGMIIIIIMSLPKIYNNLETFKLNYIDDILIYSKTFDNHIFHIEKILFALQRHNVKLKKEKCHFAQKVVIYLGHTITFNQFKPFNSNTNAIDEFIRPLKLKNVQQFIGKVNYYRKFVPSISSILNPHISLLIIIHFDWGD